MAELFKGLERIEEARERLTGSSFMAGVFVGRPDFALLLPPPEPPEEKATGEAFCRKIEAFLKSHVDPEEIERTAKIPDSVLKGLFELGAFGMKIPKEYGGLGFSYTNYGRVLTLIASWSNILSLTVAVPQSIGIAMPILLFGNEAQKRTYLPRVAREAISAFALTESITGSDAANIQTEAVLDRSGSHFLANGEKLWCTNGPIARYVTLIARVPAKNVVRDGKTAWQPTLDRANSRITFGKPLGERQTQMMRIGRMATDLFAMEALASLVWRMADQHRYDIRIEAAIAKIFCSEKAIRFLKDAQIIFGGMGYETAESRQVRGEPGFPIEQLVRDAEMYRIGEGATDILRPFVAREALSPHLERARTYLEGGLTGASKLREWLKLLRGYVPRYLGLWKRTPLPDREEFRRREVSEKLL